MHKISSKFEEETNGESVTGFLLCSMKKQSTGSYGFWEIMMTEEGGLCSFAQDIYPIHRVVSNNQYAACIATRSPRYIGSAHVIGEIIEEYKTQSAEALSASQPSTKSLPGYQLNTYLDMVYLNQFRVILSCTAETLLDRLDSHLFGPECSFAITQISQPYKLVDTPLSR